MQLHTERRRGGSQLAAILVGLLALHVLLTLPSLGAGFLGDDWHFVFYSIRNGLGYAAQAWIGSISPDILLYRPLSILSFCVDAAVWGLRPFGWHLTNLLFHAMNVVLLASLAWRRGLPAGAIFFGTAVFCLHPLAAESVFWISARMDSMTTLGLLLGMHLLQGRRPLGAFDWAGLLALAVVAVCTKELGLAVPFVWSVFRGSARSGSEGRLLFVAAMALAVTAICLRVAWFGSVGGYSVDGGWGVQALSICRNAWGVVLAPYALKLLRWPLDATSRFPVEAIAGCLIWALLIHRAYVSRTLHLLLMIGICLLPSVGLSIDPGTLEGGRFLYMASAVFGLFLASSWNDWQPKAHALARVFRATEFLGIAVLALLLSRRSGAWAESGLRADALLHCIQRQWNMMGPFEVLDLDEDSVRFLDSHRGAQLFRNGLPFAVALRLELDEPVLTRRGPSNLGSGFPIRVCIPEASP